MFSLMELESSLRAEGYDRICGVDEAGRGPLAGPVCAAAVILPPDVELPGLNDSKKLSEKKRELLFPMIQEQAVAWSVAFASVEEIEELNILRATFRAMNRAIAANHLGDRQQAQADLANLARDTKTEEGAQAAYELAQIQFDAGNNKQAEQTIEKLLDSGSPHAYWVARGFILLSDIYAKQGKTSEAREYLQSLKNSYPGKEADITEAINSRLNSLKKSKK